jgi:succinate-acetate transporter protein
MFVTTHWSESSFASNVLCYAVFYGGFAQMVAGVLELVKGNTFAGTAFFSYGSFWLAFALLKLLIAADPSKFSGAASYPVGETLFLAAWGVLTSAFFVVTLRKNGALVVVFGSLALTFFLLAGGVWSPVVNTVGGYVGFFCGCSAIYTAVAEIYHEALGLSLPGLRPVRFI